MTVASRIREKLAGALTPSRLEIVDESHKHAGHSGARPEGETHFRVVITSQAFDGLTRIERQRLVYELLASELKERIHALEIKALAPGEDSAP
ncbi:MAG: BolA family protein [Alphaproteobacteria bacterium]